MTIPGYKIDKKLYESPTSLILRARRNSDKRAVILKILQGDPPSPKRIAWFKREYDITRTLNLPGVVQAYSQETDRGRWMMVLEDFGGDSLAQLGLAGNMTLPDFLALAVKITEIIGDIHKKNIIHKDINPTNIIFNRETGRAKIIDFGISAVLFRENQAFRSPLALQGTLAYISPEQTGRVNRAMDFRSDFYSLGVTFYELLTGKLPFYADDPLEAIHNTIAAHPLPVHKIKPGIPPNVSAVVQKLMAKDAEDRYQSTYGLKYDLEKCLEYSDFKPGLQDFTGEFHLTRKLYGRDREIQTILQTFNRVSSGAAEMILTAGSAGVGKTALIEEIYRPILEKNGYFVSGKFEQYTHSTPYSAVIQALESFLDLLLQEDSEQLAAGKERILQAVGDNGRLIVDILPRLSLIIGEQQPVPELGPGETQNRFKLVFENFVLALAHEESPLVLFIDDWQWADPASLDFLKRLVSHTSSRYLLVIGAYRDDETDAAHPALRMPEELEKTGAPVTLLSLIPLREEHIRALLEDTLGNVSEDWPGLIYRKTRGNPFFVRQFLQSSYDSGLIYFDADTRRWQWQEAEIKKMSGSVTDLLVTQIESLRAPTQQALKYCACIGSRFDLQTLALLDGKSPKTTLDELWQAAEKGLITPVSGDFQATTADTIDAGVLFKFLHDRVQQAAYSLIPINAVQATNLRLGRLLLENWPAEKIEEHIFAVANRFNKGLQLLIEEPEKIKAAGLNLQAGRKAKSAAAYEEAADYLNAGLAVLPAGSWQGQYDLTLTLHVEAAQAAYLRGDLGQVEKNTAAVLKNARTLLDKVPAYEVETLAYAAHNKPRQAVKTALSALQMLGVRLPRKPNKLHLLSGLLKTKLVLTGKRPDDLLHLPAMKDPEKLAAMRILVSAGFIIYFAAPELIPLSILKMVNLSVKYGNSPESPFAYAAYGMMLCAVLGRIDSGYGFGKLAEQLSSRDGHKEHKARTLMMINYLIRPWKEHLREALEPLQETYRTGLLTGDVEYAAFGAGGYCVYAALAGKPLPQIEQEAVNYSYTLNHFYPERVYYLLKVGRQASLNLMGMSEDPCRLSGECFDETEMVPLMSAAGDKSALSYLYLQKFMSCFLFREYDRAAEIAQETVRHLKGGVGSFALAVFHFYDSLTALARCAGLPRAKQKRIKKKVAANQRKMKKWARHAPMNFLHKWHLVEAEKHRVSGRNEEAVKCYDQAVELAKEHGYLNEEALACELAALFYQGRERDFIAAAYMERARRCYSSWGAEAKVSHLEDMHPQLLEIKDYSSSAAAKYPAFQKDTTITITSLSAGDLDFDTLLKAAQAISGEIVLSDLLKKMMKIVIENVGAETGFLVLEESGQWLIEAESHVNKSAVAVLQSINVEHKKNISHGIIQHVCRSREMVVLDNAEKEGDFTGDPHVMKNRSKSILCIPLLNQGKLNGILYLENNLTTGAFTPHRVGVMNLLSAHMAISIENARLYQNLEQKVKERTQDLEQEIGERKRAEEKIEASLKEKEVLLKEIHHRVKNNLQIITSLLSLQSKYIDDQQAVAILQVSRERVRAMSLVHERLYESKDLSKIDLREYIRNLIAYLFDSYSLHAGRVKSKTRIGNIGLGIDTAIPLGLIINELISNSLKYAFPEKKKGEIRVNLTKSKDKEYDYTLIAADNGIGIPEDIDFRQSNSLGMQLVTSLVMQLHGVIDLDREGGTKFTIKFKKKE